MVADHEGRLCACKEVSAYLSTRTLCKHSKPYVDSYVQIRRTRSSRVTLGLVKSEIVLTPSTPVRAIHAIWDLGITQIVRIPPARTLSSKPISAFLLKALLSSVGLVSDPRKIFS